MCGIIGIANKNEAVNNDLINALFDLEYRGYDSCGIIFDNFESYKTTNSINFLKQMSKNSQEKIGIAHTRWATHGKVCLENTHPIKVKKFAIVHNGILENANFLQKQIKYKPVGETDTEILLAVFEHLCKTLDKIEALKELINISVGSFAIAILSFDDKKIYFAKKGISPLIFAYNDEQKIITSDLSVLKKNYEVFQLEDNDYGYFDAENFSITTKKSFKNELKKNMELSNKYSSFFESEMHEQAELVALEMNKEIEFDFEKYLNIILLGCGSSYIASMIGKYWFEEINKFAKAEIASEWNVATASFPQNCLSIFLSQSGETADTLLALKKAKNNLKTLALVNNESSTMAKEANFLIPLNAGVEKSVASTKSFMMQLLKLYKLTHKQKLDLYIKEALNYDLKDIAKTLLEAKKIMILGKNKLYPIALEGSLKLQELTYKNVSAFAAGEFKHGYIALIDDESFVISLIASDENEVLKNKTISSTQEVIARGAKVILISDFNYFNTPYFIKLSKQNYDQAVFSYTIILQKITLEMTMLMKNNIDKPRNLAKSVTVE